MEFEWDPRKAASNEVKHGVSFTEAMHVFEDPYALFLQDRIDETGEARWQILGTIDQMSIVLVVHTIRGEEPASRVRLISARRATRKERRIYEEARAGYLGG